MTAVHEVEWLASTKKAGHSLSQHSLANILPTGSKQNYLSAFPEGG